MARDLPQPLEGWAEQLDRMQWSALLTDPDWNLLWTSRSLRGFLRVTDDAELGYGEPLAQAWTTRDEWLQSATPDSRVQLFLDVAPHFARAMSDRGFIAADLLAEPFATLLGEVAPAEEIPLLWSGSFEYQDPQDPELPEYRVNFAAIRLNGDGGEPAGMLMIFFTDVNPNLMALLVRGDQAMYQRMAQLMDPQPRQAAVLFCDLHQSGRLSRELSSAAYFKLVRRLWTGIDAVIARECGIVGKHAGDGASAFFLAAHTGSASAAAAAAVRAARSIHRAAATVFKDIVDRSGLVKVGVHWGGGLYMGQLVPGSRLDVTALGDEVNEAARVQESAEAGTTLATKQLLQRLAPEDAADLAIDLEATRFTVLGDLPSADDKARRDAGGLAVALID